MSCKFIRTVERLRPVCEEVWLRGAELLDERRGLSCCRPALTAAAAWSEVDADLGDGEGLWPRKAVASVLEMPLAIAGELVIDLEGGKELRSGIGVMEQGLLMN